jgi:hypothetical protein
MQVAYLLFVYNQPEHFARLIRALDAPWAHFFIHVDKKADLSAFTSKVPESPHVHYILSRQRVYWGHYSGVEAILGLLRHSRHLGPAFKYHILLSGADYPIKSRAVIYDTLAQSRLQHLTIECRLLDRFAQRITQWWFIGHPLLQLRPEFSCDPRTFRGATFFQIARRARFCASIVEHLLPRRSYPYPTPYKGSTWWALTDDCAQYVLSFVDRNPGYVRFHRYTHIPEEHFFHSIIKASPFANSISQDIERGCQFSTRFGLHYIQWPKVVYNSPVTLAGGDLDALLATDALFARKFSDKESRSLLDALDGIVRA